MSGLCYVEHASNVQNGAVRGGGGLSNKQRLSKPKIAKTRNPEPVIKHLLDVKLVEIYNWKGDIKRLNDEKE